MNENKMQQVRSFMTGLAVGSAIGASAALFKAPRSGEETRQELQKRAGQLQQRAAEKVETVREAAQDKAQQIAHKAEAAQAKVQQVAGKAKEQVAELKS